MAFFLLGRSEDGDLSLLSALSFESRQDALAELGRITAQPTFSNWDDEVLMLDLESGTPVLLVRPADQASPATESDAPASDEPETALDEVETVPDETDTVDDETADGQGADDEETPEPEETVFAGLADEDDAEPHDVSGHEQSDEPVESATDEPEPADAQSDDAEVDEPAVTEEAPEATDEASEAPAGDTEDSPAESTDQMDALRAAIARTTEHMEASGIVAPESIGPAAEEPADETPDDAESAEEPVEPASEDAGASAEPSAWPWATETPATVIEVEDLRPAPDIAFVLDGLEEPAIDDGGSLITAAVDDETLASNRPVILGAYGDSEPSTDKEAAPDEDVASTVAGEESPFAEDSSADTGDTEAEEDAGSDFIVLDDVAAPAETTEPTEPASATPDTPETDREDVLGLSSYSCADCVYVDTCPNKDQRRPEDCGSFQWK